MGGSKGILSALLSIILQSAFTTFKHLMSNELMDYNRNMHISQDPPSYIAPMEGSGFSEAMEVCGQSHTSARETFCQLHERALTFPQDFMHFTIS